MPNLPRIDQVETAIEDQLEQGIILKDLSNELTSELDALGLLRPLLKDRVKTVVLSYRAKKEGEEIEEGQDTIEKKDDEEYLQEISKRWYENQIDRYYLERRDSLETVTFELFRTTSKGIAIEAYQRLVEEEESWQTIVERWGMDADKGSHGRYSKIPANKINHAVYQQLKRLENGKISQPFRYANIIAITKLIKWNQIQLGETMKSTLEADLLESWLQEQVAKIVQHIEQTN
jgi:hypothetical protein